jgi:predicted nucleotidyltransferase
MDKKELSENLRKQDYNPMKPLVIEEDSFNVQTAMTIMNFIENHDLNDEVDNDALLGDLLRAVVSRVNELNEKEIDPVCYGAYYRSNWETMVSDNEYELTDKGLDNLKEIDSDFWEFIYNSKNNDIQEQDFIDLLLEQGYIQKCL